MTEHPHEPCPYLPLAAPEMSHRSLGKCQADSTEFYFSALQYGQFLWCKGIAGRAILALTRALYADIDQSNPILVEWPLPYAALKWIVAHHLSDDFPGNPRVSFQHQATRLQGDREALRRARAWATWALIRQARPSLPADPKDPVEEPSLQEIFDRLTKHGHTGEAELWKCALSRP